MTRKMLITGGSGFIGQNLVKGLTDMGEVHYTTFEHPTTIPWATEHRVDLREPAVVKSLLEEVSPEVVIHTAAMTKIDQCEKNWHEAYLLNVRTTISFAQTARLKKARLVFLSTDLVFSGEQGGYREGDRPTPYSNYGWTKLMAESHVHRSSAENTILRCALTYGWGAEGRDGFNGWMKRSFERGERLRLFTDEYRTPLFVGDLIQVVRQLCEKVRPGMFHVGGRERISRHDFGLRFAAVFGFDPGLIDGVSVEEYEGVRRAKDVSLNIDHTAAEFGIDFHAVLDGLDALKRSGKEGQR